MNTAVKNSMNAMFGAVKNAEPTEVAIALIDVVAQDRTEFEDDNNQLSDFASNVKAVGVLSPVLLRPRPAGRYELVAGERRLRAAKLAGLTVIPCKIKTLTDEEAADAQFFENTHRKNLTNIEEANKLQKMLDRLKGDRAALQAKVGKSPAWISQRLNLLTLSPQAQRLVDENISSDVTSINNIKQIEKHDPAAARALVDQAANAPAKTDLRKASEAAKKTAKVHSAPSKPGATPKTTGNAPSTATPRDRSQEAPGGVSVSSVFPAPPQKPHEKVITAFVDMAKKPGADVGKLAASVSAQDLALITKHGEVFFQKGKGAVELGQALIAGLTKNEFGKGPVELFNLMAFVQGQAGSTKFEAGEALASICSASTVTK